MASTPAPPRLVRAFGTVILAAGLVTLVRAELAGSLVATGVAGAAGVVLGATILLRAREVTLSHVAWVCALCTFLIAVAVASRPTPYGAGYMYVWIAPFAFMAGRRAGTVMTALAAVTLAGAFAVQAARVDDPLALQTYASWWLVATGSVLVVGVITRGLVTSLQATQEQLERGFRQGVRGMAFLDHEGRWHRVNPALAAMLGRDEAELAGTLPSAVGHPDDAAITADWMDVIHREGHIAFEKRYVRPGGEIRWVAVRATALQDGGGERAGYFAEYEDVTGRRVAEERMRQSERRFERAFEDAGTGMLLVGLDGVVHKVNRAMCELLGGPPQRLVGACITEFQHPDELDGTELGELLRGERDGFQQDGRYRDVHGHDRHGSVTVALVRDDAGVAQHAIVQLQDITARVAARRREAALAALGRHALSVESLADLFAEATRTAAATLDAPYATLLEACDAGEILAAEGWDGEPARGHAVAVLDAPDAVVLDDVAVAPPGIDTAALVAAGVHCGAAVAVLGEGEAPFAVLAVHARGGTRLNEYDVAFLRSAANVLTAALRREAAEQELRHRTLHDPLTRLPNRALLVDRVRLALPRARRDGKALAVLVLDLDDFKNVNDTYGHDAGDELLRALAPRLQGALRANDTLARLGADEFVALCEGLEDPEEALGVAERLLAATAEPLPVPVVGEEVRCTASIGIALAGAGDDGDAEGLLRDADLAMHRAKAAGPGGYEIFEHAMRTRALQRVALTNDLDRALARDELVLAFQPIVSLADGRIVGAESLVRWHHPDRGLIMPDAFIGLAERTGRIVDLGRWVIRDAACHAARWPQLTVGVNVSRRQLSDPGLVGDVAAALAEHGVAAERFCVEVTETALMDDPAGATRALHALRELGVRIALDDFGTGYSSLSSLSEFPLDTLKLDRSFLPSEPSLRQGWSIVRAVLDMARTLRFEVVAEGVETAAQRDELAGLGCALGQGYLFSRPIAPGALGELLSTSASSPAAAPPR
ncbi:MAG TPA: EAL domain-containing protein [Baekduia sp.]|uniref:sensor domain-containing protein n=1 Tax=Baekduia sp. TaxID=2600305 RepID=UPI002B9C6A33|nr:EAL domain-containing protein [Baekduia sp.]HMJ36536.1 EAL domain-containing protein [Baekduia sp.]